MNEAIATLREKRQAVTADLGRAKTAYDTAKRAADAAQRQVTDLETLRDVYDSAIEKLQPQPEPSE